MRRGDIRGSTRKLYKQKGTGRARVGSARAPIRRGGGKAHGTRSIVLAITHPTQDLLNRQLIGRTIGHCGAHAFPKLLRERKGYATALFGKCMNNNCGSNAAASGMNMHEMGVFDRWFEGTGYQ